MSPDSPDLGLDLPHVPFMPLNFPEFHHFGHLFDPSLYNTLNGYNELQQRMKAFLGSPYYPHEHFSSSKPAYEVPREALDTMKEEEGPVRATAGLVADPSYVVPVGGFEVRVVVVQGRALYCANDVMMAVGIKTSVRSTLYKLREKHPDLCRVGVLTKLSGSITGQAMTCYPLRVCTPDCAPFCQYELCTGFKPLETILSSLGRGDFVKVFVMTELELLNCSNTFVWPTPWWRERIQKAVSQRDLKRALNAANKRDRRDKLLHLADVACIAGGSRNHNAQVTAA